VNLAVVREVLSIFIDAGAHRARSLHER